MIEFDGGIFRGTEYEVVDRTNRKRTTDNRKRIDFLAEMSKGKLYTESVDTTKAYRKTVTNGTKGAAVTEMDGESVVWNQLAPVVDKTLSASGTRTKNIPLSAGTKIVQGRKYYIGYTLSGMTSSATMTLTMYSRLNTSNIVEHQLIRSTSGVFSEVFIAQNNATSNGTGSSAVGNVWMYASLEDVAGQSGTISNVLLIDLTLMFGAGNEPDAATMDKLLEGVDLSYNAGTIENSDVNKVRTISPQMISAAQLRATGDNNGVTFTNNGDGSYTLNGTANGGRASYGLIQPVHIVQNHIYVLRGCQSGGSYANGYSLYMFSSDFETNMFDSGTGVRGKALQTKDTYANVGVADGITVNNVIIKMQLYDLTDMFGAGNEPTLAEFQAMSVPAEYGVIDEQTIPAEIRALPDWSKLGSKLVYENGKWMYYRRGVEVDGGSKTWSKTSNGRAFYVTFGSMVGGGVVCVPYAYAQGRTASNIGDGEITINPSGNVMIRDAERMSMTGSEFRSYMTGKTIRHEAAEEVADAQDVTDMMPDIMLRCANGTTIEFTQENNHIPIGNSTTYYIRLEDAV